MGDLLGGGKSTPAVDPTTGQPNPYQPQTGIMGALNNPGVQGLLATYFGAVSSPREAGLGGAIGRGGLSGLQAYSNAQQQQQMLPYMQAELQAKQLQAKQLGMELKPLTADQVQGLTDWKNTIAAKKGTADYDPYELAYATQLESQARGGQLTSKDLLTSMNAFHESNLMQAMFKNRGAAAGAAFMHAQGYDVGDGTGQPQGQGQGQQQAQTQQIQLPQGFTMPKAGEGAKKVNIPGVGDVTFQVNPKDGKMYWITPDTKQWQPVGQ